MNTTVQNNTTPKTTSPRRSRFPGKESGSVSFNLTALGRQLLKEQAANASVSNGDYVEMLIRERAGMPPLRLPASLKQTGPKGGAKSYFFGKNRGTTTAVCVTPMAHRLLDEQVAASRMSRGDYIEYLLREKAGIIEESFKNFNLAAWQAQQAQMQQVQQPQPIQQPQPVQHQQPQPIEQPKPQTHFAPPQPQPAVYQQPQTQVQQPVQRPQPQVNYQQPQPQVQQPVQRPQPQVQQPQPQVQRPQPVLNQQPQVQQPQPQVQQQQPQVKVEREEEEEREVKRPAPAPFQWTNS